MYIIYDERNHNEVVLETNDLQKVRRYLTWDENNYSQCEDIDDIDDELQRENGGICGYRVKKIYIKNYYVELMDDDYNVYDSDFFDAKDIEDAKRLANIYYPSADHFKIREETEEEKTKHILEVFCASWNDVKSYLKKRNFIIYEKDEYFKELQSETNVEDLFYDYDGDIPTQEEFKAGNYDHELVMRLTGVEVVKYLGEQYVLMTWN